MPESDRTLGLNGIQGLAAPLGRCSQPVACKIQVSAHDTQVPRRWAHRSLSLPRHLFLQDLFGQTTGPSPGGERVSRPGHLHGRQVLRPAMGVPSRMCTHVHLCMPLSSSPCGHGSRAGPLAPCHTPLSGSETLGSSLHFPGKVDGPKPQVSTIEQVVAKGLRRVRSLGLGLSLY